jgi:hypothetical protein
VIDEMKSTFCFFARIFLSSIDGRCIDRDHFLSEIEAGCGSRGSVIGILSMSGPKN